MREPISPRYDSDVHHAERMMGPVQARASLGAVTMSLDVLWHDLECGAYREDLALWHTLAGALGGPVLDIGAGTGRVSLDLAVHGVPVVALEAEALLLAALERRAAGLPVETVVADARGFALGRRFPLILVPMQTLQLLGGARGRTAFLRHARDHLEPGGLVAAAVADAVDSFDSEHPLPPPPDACEIDGVWYASRLVGVEDEGDRAAIHRRREIVGPADRYETEDIVVRLDRVSAGEIAAQARRLGFARTGQLLVRETEEYLGSTVVVLRAP
jgi:SAM-dependent methyltransferase